MPNCNICHKPIDPGERVAFHNNGTCHFRCLSKEDREELEGLGNLQKRMKGGASKLEILEELQRRDKNRTPQEVEEDKADREQIDRLMKIQKMAGAKSPEEFRTAKEEFSKTINLRPTKSPEEILKEARARGDERTAAEAERLIREREEDKKDIEEIQRLVAAQEKLRRINIKKEETPAPEQKSNEESMRERLDILKDISPEDSSDVEELKEGLKKIPEIKKNFCVVCGKPASALIDENYYCNDHRQGTHGGSIISRRPPPPPPPRIVSIRTPTHRQDLPPLRIPPTISRPSPIINRPPVSREQPPLFQFSSVNEVKCPFCGSSGFLRVLERHGGEIEYECENPACA